MWAAGEAPTQARHVLLEQLSGDEGLLSSGTPGAGGLLISMNMASAPGGVSGKGAAADGGAGDLAADGHRDPLQGTSTRRRCRRRG